MQKRLDNMDRPSDNQNDIERDDKFYDCLSSMHCFVEDDVKVCDESQDIVPDHHTMATRHAMATPTFSNLRNRFFSFINGLFIVASALTTFGSCHTEIGYYTNNYSVYINATSSASLHVALGDVFSKRDVDTQQFAPLVIWGQPILFPNHDQYHPIMTSPSQPPGMNYLPSNFESHYPRPQSTRSKSSSQPISTALMPYPGMREKKSCKHVHDVGIPSKDRRLIPLPSEPEYNCVHQTILGGDTSLKDLLTSLINMKILDRYFENQNHNRCSWSEYQELLQCSPDDFENSTLNACPPQNTSLTDTWSAYLYHSYRIDSAKFHSNYINLDISRQKKFTFEVISALFYGVVLSLILWCFNTQGDDGGHGQGTNNFNISANNSRRLPSRSSGSRRNTLNANIPRVLLNQQCSDPDVRSSEICTGVTSPCEISKAPRSPSIHEAHTGISHKEIEIHRKLFDRDSLKAVSVVIEKAHALQGMTSYSRFQTQTGLGELASYTFTQDFPPPVPEVGR